MNPELLPLALGANRLFVYTGYVLLAGTLTFWSLVWPEGRRDRKLVAMSIVGIALLTLSSIAEPMLDVFAGETTWEHVVSPIVGAALLLRLAALAAAAFFLVDIVRKCTRPSDAKTAYGVCDVPQSPRQRRACQRAGIPHRFGPRRWVERQPALCRVETEGRCLRRRAGVSVCGA